MTAEEKAQSYAIKCQYLSDYVHDLKSSNDGYLAGYNQALIDVWAEIELIDKNVIDGRYLITSEQLLKLERKYGNSK